MACSIRLRQPFIWSSVFLLGACGVMQPVDDPSSERLFGVTPPPDGAASSPTEYAGGENYAADLGQAPCDADTRCVALVRPPGVVTNNNVNFNALGWTLGRAVLYYMLTDAHHSLLLPTSAAAGFYGYAISGPPGRAGIDRAAAKTITCGIVNAAPYSLTIKEFNGGGATVKGFDADLNEFEQPER